MLDEEYFTQALAPVAMGTVAADAVLADFAVKHRSGQSRWDTRSLNEFADRPSDLYLPGDLILKRLEGARIKRVTWKIIRGLYTIETDSVLPKDMLFVMELIEPESRDKPKGQDLWELVKAQPSQGRFGAAFDYKHLHAKEGDKERHAWGMLFWDRIMVFVAHRGPGDIDT